MTYSETGIQIVRVEAWERYPWLRHGFSTRAGGVSAVYGGGSLNLGWTKEDVPDSVRENRRRFARAVTCVSNSEAAFSLVGVRQIHSTILHEVRTGDGALERRLETEEGKPILEGDGLMTGLPGVLIAVGIADCVPVLVADRRKRVVAAFHAGWRGTASRIVEAGIARLRESYGSRAEDLVAAIGPSIGPCCYSVGDDVRAEFAANFGYSGYFDRLFRKITAPEPWRSRTISATSDSPAQSSEENFQERLHLDLWEANRRQLLDAGVPEAQITVLAACTACSRDSERRLQFFSHRGEQGIAGRMLGAIGVADKQPRNDSSAHG